MDSVVGRVRHDQGARGRKGHTGAQGGCKGARVLRGASGLLEGEVCAPPLLGALVDEPRELQYRKCS